MRTKIKIKSSKATAKWKIRKWNSAGTKKHDEKSHEKCSFFFLCFLLSHFQRFRSLFGSSIRSRIVFVIQYAFDVRRSCRWRVVQIDNFQFIFVAFPSDAVFVLDFVIALLGSFQWCWHKFHTRWHRKHESSKRWKLWLDSMSMVSQWLTQWHGGASLINSWFNWEMANYYYFSTWLRTSCGSQSIHFVSHWNDIAVDVFIGIAFTWHAKQ